MAFITSRPLPSGGFHNHLYSACVQVSLVLNARDQGDEGTFSDLRSVLSKACSFVEEGYKHARPVTPNGSSYSTFLDTLVEGECFKTNDGTDFDGGELATAKGGAIQAGEMYQRWSGALRYVLNGGTGLSDTLVAYAKSEYPGQTG